MLFLAWALPSLSREKKKAAIKVRSSSSFALPSLLSALVISLHSLDR